MKTCDCTKIIYHIKCNDNCNWYTYKCIDKCSWIYLVHTIKAYQKYIYFLQRSILKQEKSLIYYTFYVK